MITDRYPLDDVAAAVDNLASGAHPHRLEHGRAQVSHGRRAHGAGGGERVIL